MWFLQAKQLELEQERSRSVTDDGAQLTPEQSVATTDSHVMSRAEEPSASTDGTPASLIAATSGAGAADTAAPRSRGLPSNTIPAAIASSTDGDAADVEALHQQVDQLKAEVSHVLVVLATMSAYSNGSSSSS